MVKYAISWADIHIRESARIAARKAVWETAKCLIFIAVVATFAIGAAYIDQQLDMRDAQIVNSSTAVRL